MRRKNLRYGRNTSHNTSLYDLSEYLLGWMIYFLDKLQRPSKDIVSICHIYQLQTNKSNPYININHLSKLQLHRNNIR